MIKGREPIKIGNDMIYPAWDMPTEEWKEYRKMLEQSKEILGEKITNKLAIETARDLK